MYDVVNMPDLVVRYFSSTPWLVAFVISTVYLFIRLNTTRKRAMLVAVAIFFLIINAFVIRIFTKLNQNSTFYRHLWAIPSIAIVSIAIIDLIRLLPKWFLKVSAIVAFAILFWFINDQEYIRCRTQFLSLDAKLVPEDVIVLEDKLNELRSETGKSTQFVVCPIAYQRSYGNMCTELSLYSGFLNVSDSSILNDINHNGEEELTGENPDVEYIMSTTCLKGMDYVVVGRISNSEELFREQGYEPLLITNEYILYRCEGYSGCKQDLNSWGQPSWKYWYKENGELCINENGFAKVQYVYDNRGRKITETYTDEAGALVNIIEGYAKCEWRYGNKGLEEIRLFDANGNPCIRKDFGYSSIRYIRDEKGRVIEECYYNEKNELFDFDFRNPRARTRFEYDNQGNVISEKYFDKDGNLSRALAGYDEIRKQYDENSVLIRLGYYADGKLINRTDTGYAEVNYQSDETGDWVQYIDQDGSIVILQEQ